MQILTNKRVNAYMFLENDLYCQGSSCGRYVPRSKWMIKKRTKKNSLVPDTLIPMKIIGIL